MQCPKCKHKETKVLESRPAQDNEAIRRRRECVSCGFRFSTYEQVEILELTVVKRDGRREAYSFDKLKSGINRAFEKRSISEKVIKRFAEEIEREIQKKAKDSEISSATIGLLVIKKLKKKDPVAYMRFASVYLQFQNISDFQEAISTFSGYKVAPGKKVSETTN